MSAIASVSSQQEFSDESSFSISSTSSDDPTFRVATATFDIYASMRFCRKWRARRAVRRIPVEELPNLLPTLTPTQISWLTQVQIASIPEETMAGMSRLQADGLDKDQIKQLSFEQAAVVLPLLSRERFKEVAGKIPAATLLNIGHRLPISLLIFGWSEFSKEQRLALAESVTIVQFQNLLSFVKEKELHHWVNESSPQRERRLAVTFAHCSDDQFARLFEGNSTLLESVDFRALTPEQAHQLSDRKIKAIAENRSALRIVTRKMHPAHFEKIVSLIGSWELLDLSKEGILTPRHLLIGVNSMSREQIRDIAISFTPEQFIAAAQGLDPVYILDLIRDPVRDIALLAEACEEMTPSEVMVIESALPEYHRELLVRRLLE